MIYKTTLLFAALALGACAQSHPGECHEADPATPDRPLTPARCWTNDAGHETCDCGDPRELPDAG